VQGNQRRTIVNVITVDLKIESVPASRSRRIQSVHGYQERDHNIYLLGRYAGNPGDDFIDRDEPKIIINPVCEVAAKD